MYQFEHLNFACADLMAALHAKSFEAPWNKKDFADLLTLSTTKGLINEKGMIVCSICGEDAEILTLCVSPEYRRQGIAAQMIQKMCEYMKNFQVVSLFLEVLKRSCFTFMYIACRYTCIQNEILEYWS